MTEFLMFLGLCLVFSVVFWLFLRRPSKVQRIKAQAEKEIREARAKVAAERANQAADAVPPKDDPSGPFGENIVNPDSRTIPPAFHGDWTKDGRIRETITADRMVFFFFGQGEIRAREEQTVVAVRYIRGPAEVAIVTQTPEGNFSLRYRGIDEDGRLLDLENMDWKLDRALTRAASATRG